MRIDFFAIFLRFARCIFLGLLYYPALHPHETPSGLCGRMLPAARAPGLPVLRPSGLGGIAGPLPGYGLIPQRGSACPGRAAALNPPAVRNIPRVTAPFAGAARYGYGLGDPLPHDHIIRSVVYLSILCQSDRTMPWHKMKSQTPKQAGELFPGVLSLEPAPCPAFFAAYRQRTFYPLSKATRHNPNTWTYTGKTCRRHASLVTPLAVPHSRQLAWRQRD